MQEAAEVFYTIILATVLFMVMITIIVIAIGRYYARKRTHEMSLLYFDHTLLQTRLEIQEQTFKAISQEMHDNMGQLLTLAKLQLNTLNLDKPEQASEKINGAIDLVSHTIQSIRDLSRSLHSESVQQTGLVGALENEIRIIEKLGIMQPVFQVFGEPVAMEENKCLIIFRIVQEALHNVVKHSKATIVEMNIHFSVPSIIVTIQDNGTGFSEGNHGSGSGLRNMKDRAKVIGADFSIESGTGKGTMITLTIPHS